VQCRRTDAHRAIVLPDGMAWRHSISGLAQVMRYGALFSCWYFWGPRVHRSLPALCPGRINAGQSLAFKISGEGTLQARVEGGGTQGESTSSQNDNRPGGGLGPPSDAPDPLQQYRWYILGGFAIVLVVGAVFVASRRRAVARSASPAGGQVPAIAYEYEGPEITDASVERPSTPRAVLTQPSAPRSVLLEELKEELFRLEVEHQQGEISKPEYDKTKSALDQMLQRALKRAATNHD
jgi:hypothetical protein